MIVSAKHIDRRDSTRGTQRHIAVAAEIRPTRRSATSQMRGARGVTSIEYALLAALIAMAILVVVQGLGSAVFNLFNHVATCAANMFQGC